MFSARLAKPVVGAPVAWLAAIILVAGVVPKQVHARTSPVATVEPGDPDEFEGRMLGGFPGSVDKPSLCGDSQTACASASVGDGRRETTAYERRGRRRLLNGIAARVDILRMWFARKLTLI